MVNSVNGLPRFCVVMPSSATIGSRSTALAPSRTAAASEHRLKCGPSAAGSGRERASARSTKCSRGSYISQNDLRIHFGLGKADRAELIEIRWPSGQVDTVKDIKANHLIVVEEGKGVVKTQAFDTVKNAKSGS